ncbi:MAG TPA: zf-HC2 domain-containing protein [Burkholderiaceae bacterium]|jgi:hypothetical protein|nr:zf-HC2 domain-containing protein [Burkholderiaceae bacterium]
MPKLRLNCREVTRLTLEGEDRRLGLFDRIGIRLHLMICDACPRFAKQVKLMRQAIGQWRQYRDAE